MGASAPYGIPDAVHAWRDNWTHGAGTLHMEILHLASRSVWLAQEAVTHERFDSIVLPDGFAKTGIGAAVADVAWFARSPGDATDGPLETIEIDGLRFARVAVPGAPEPGFRGVLVLPVHKHHTVLYRAGRTLEVMECGDGCDSVPLVTGARGPGLGVRTAARTLPDGWSVRTLTLDRDLVVRLPNPTRVAFFANGDSFQGPVRLEP
jgi:hypothetical protein